MPQPLANVIRFRSLIVMPNVFLILWKLKTKLIFWERLGHFGSSLTAFFANMSFSLLERALGGKVLHIFSMATLRKDGWERHYLATANHTNNQNTLPTPFTTAVKCLWLSSRRRMYTKTPFKKNTRLMHEQTFSLSTGVSVMQKCRAHSVGEEPRCDLLNAMSVFVQRQLWYLAAYWPASAVQGSEWARLDKQGIPAGSTSVELESPFSCNDQSNLVLFTTCWHLWMIRDFMESCCRKTLWS